MESKSVFTKTEIKVIRGLYLLGREATINEIAKVSKVSWNTAKKIIKKFYIKCILSKKELDGRIYYVIKRFITD